MTTNDHEERSLEMGNNRINIEVPEEVADGEYANLAMISHSKSDFVFDFIRILPGLPKAKVKSRVIMTPEHAKRLAHALGENVSRYENQHGTIDSGSVTPDINLGPTAEA
tara:strand:+ start:796 stop:1125 length:330 start_codon:yes stop_codon:yes gene_type:complete